MARRGLERPHAQTNAFVPRFLLQTCFWRQYRALLCTLELIDKKHEFTTESSGNFICGGFWCCRAQSSVPASLLELKYPPIARAARVQGDVVVSFRRSPKGRTVDVAPISGPPLLRATAVENVKSWRFEQIAELAGQVGRVIFHFRLNAPRDGYDDSQPTTKIALDGTDGIQVISIFTTGLERSECPNAAERVPPAAVLSGDFVEVRRWNEMVSVGADGSIVWKQGDISQVGQTIPTEAKSLLELFRAPAAWALCGRYE